MIHAFGLGPTTSHGEKIKPRIGVTRNSFHCILQTLLITCASFSVGPSLKLPLNLAHLYR